MIPFIEARPPLWRVMMTRRRPRWHLLAAGFVTGWIMAEVFVKFTH